MSSVKLKAKSTFMTTRLIGTPSSFVIIMANLIGVLFGQWAFPVLVLTPHPALRATFPSRGRLKNFPHDIYFTHKQDEEIAISYGRCWVCR
jgi:hypothetical protein